jgi:imidazoleglycerol-phosphate dehydratase
MIMSDAPRTATFSRRTRETAIEARLVLDGSGLSEVRTGLGFFDHMLGALAKHGAFDLVLKCEGDLHIDQHHTVEDSAIVLGQCFDRALADRAGVSRAGHAYFPLDEALARAVVDLSGRPYLVWNVDPAVQGPNSPMDLTVLEGFFKALADGARCALHLDLLRGRDFHHSAEALFKATARALRDACALDPRVQGIPSTKGVL